MNATVSGMPGSGVGKRRSFILWVVFFVVGLLALSRGVEYLVLTHYERDWERIADRTCSEYLSAAAQAFGGNQRSARRVATKLAQMQTLQDYLIGRSNDRAAVFDQVSKTSGDQNVGLEVYNRSGELVAWDGISGPSHQAEVNEALNGRLVSLVSRSPVYAELFVATPIWIGRSVVGVILVRRMVEVNYPFSNRYIERQGLTEELSRALGATIEFDFSPSAVPRKDGRYASTVLSGFDGTRVGVVSVLRPVRSAYLESLSAAFQRVNSSLMAILVAIAVTTLVAWSRRLKSLVARSLLMTALIWLSRYCLLWLELPSTFFNGGVFDPVYFASKFGAGLAKSVGDLTLTTLALLVNVVFVAILIMRKGERVSPWWRPHNAALTWISALFSVSVMFVLLRGFAATVRSVVFDSTLNFGDPSVILPSAAMAMMVLNLLLLSFCLLTAAVGLTSFIASLFLEPTSRLRHWGIAAGLVASAGILFGTVYPNPLASLPYRLAFGALAVGLTYFLHWLPRRRRPVLTLSSFVIVLAVATVCVHPMLSQMVREKDRDLAEVLAAQVLRPVDSWLRFLVDDALTGFSDEDSKDILLSGRPDAIERLAFTRWARSTVNKEGYASYFALIDTNGTILSEFRIGSQSYLVAQLFAGRKPPRQRVIQVGHIGSGLNASDVYGGWTPISDGEQLLGYGLAAVIAGQQPLFRDAGPPILRDVSQRRLETFYRPSILSEYRDGRLVSSTSNSVPNGNQLPADVQTAFGSSAAVSVWSDEVIDDKDYETLFARSSVHDGRVVSLGIEKPDLAWHVVNGVKVLVDFSFVALLVMATSLLVGRLQGTRYVFRFRDKLLVALLVTAVIPLVLMAWYGRIYAGRRMLEQTEKQLEEETATVVASIAEPADTASATPGSLLNSWGAEQVAADLGTDFNVYRESNLQVSSRPELYEAGIIDRRLSGSAYANIILRGKRFYMERENIGLYQYVVGYRPLLAGDGRVVGTVSVPTIYRQDELDEDISRQNAFLFGLFAIVLLTIVGIATTFANRIAAPIHSLTEATKKVAQGDLDVALRLPKTEGEIGELMRTFETMTKDLKQNRENLVRFERELAWKEMARQVAHEIKNPLTPMKLSIQHLRQTYRDKAPDFDRILEEVSSTIVAQIDALSRIASEFSHFGRMPRPLLERCDINAIVRESVSLFGTEGAIQFTLLFTPGHPHVSADREELRRAFINIIRNGIQAMSNSGQMVIETRTEGNHAVVSFQDFGVGLSEEAKGKLFQPNFSTKTDGMGLGLAIVKRTIDDLKGSITVESKVSEGTRVMIRLPLAQ